MTKGSEYKLWLWARCVKPDEMLDLSNTTHTHTHSNIYNNIQRSCFSIYIYTPPLFMWSESVRLRAALVALYFSYREQCMTAFVGPCD